MTINTLVETEVRLSSSVPMDDNAVDVSAEDSDNNNGEIEHVSS